MSSPGSVQTVGRVKSRDMLMIMKQKAAQGIGRRQLLRLGAGSVGILFGKGLLRDWNSSAFGAVAESPRCVVRPEQTEGPYFVDGKLHRFDIRSDPGDGTIRPGAPLRLQFQVSRVTGNACAPLSGAIVNVWHCDAQGVYSDVRDPRFDTRGKTFLRGYQRTDENGTAAFLTIYPGWYPGRAVHIHFKIRSVMDSRRSLEFTSQLYFDEAVSDRIFQQSPYNAKQGRRVANEADFLFRRSGKELLLPVAKSAQGYAGVFSIGLQGA